MLEESLASYLREKRIAPRVVTSRIRVPVDYVLAGRIHRFEQVIGNGAAIVVVDLEFLLRDFSSGTVLWEDRYRREQNATDPTIEASVTAMSGTVAEIFSQLSEDLSRL